MLRFYRLAVCVVLAFPFAASAQKHRALPNPLRNLLSVSDLHFDPFHDAGLVPLLRDNDYTEWSSIFQLSDTAVSPYGKDANYRLFVSTLKKMRSVNPKPSFIIMTGDFLRHSFQSAYTSSGGDPDSLRSFTSKTIHFIVQQLDSAFPNTVILPVLGNNDSDSNDYVIQPSDAFLNMFARAWVKLLRFKTAAAADAFVDQFVRGGYYTYPIPNAQGDLVALNTVFFSHEYMDMSSGMPPTAPGDAELAWADSVLKVQTKKARPVWMMYHVPPGADVFQSICNSNGCGCGWGSDTLVMQMTDSFNTRFLGLVQQYANTIKAMFAGHTHMDDFRVLYNKIGKPVSFIHITPAVSPLFGNNPSFQQISWNSRTLGLQNIHTYHIDSVSTNSQWSYEYNYQNTYNINVINAATLSDVRTKIWSNAAYRNHYIQYFASGHLNTKGPCGGLDATDWQCYWWGTGKLTRAEFLQHWSCHF